VNALLGHTNVRNDLPNLYAVLDNDGGGKAYVLAPRSGFWMARDLLEIGASTGDFVSVIRVNLASA
jgi:hypothetical protein